MKLLIRSIQIITALILVFLSIGMLKPNYDSKSEIVLDKPIEESFNYIISEDKLKTWLPNLKSIDKKNARWLSLNEDTILNFTNKESLKTLALRIDKLEIHEEILFSLIDKKQTSQVRITFEELENKTKLTVNQKITPKGLFWKSVMFFNQSSIREQAENLLLKFKQQLEKEDQFNVS
ncbi:SRPBCC family protein [Pleionea sediminis]|uniref:SRPBCC family protein n=1 Tax=Pleionea sediminis TaxID=2569479 RepID=UPI0011853FA5|nr:SRPBCC family protein [Pleionea sediminis]